VHTVILWSNLTVSGLLCADIREVFELFDFWDGRDGEVDAHKVGDMCFCLGLNPTQETIHKHGGTLKLGTY
jgi:hypothetical protein